MKIKHIELTEWPTWAAAKQAVTSSTEGESAQVFSSRKAALEAFTAPDRAGRVFYITRYRYLGNVHFIVTEIVQD